MQLPPNQDVRGLRVAVTGAAGFIGSHLVDSLLVHGAREVIAIDSLAFGAWTNILAASDRRVCLIETDFARLSGSELVKMLDGVDVLLHFAAEKHNNAIDTPDRVIDVNIAGTHRLYEAAGQAGVGGVIFASSLYAYGRMSGGPMIEHEAAMAQTVYGVSKLAGEGLLRQSALKHGFRHKSLRFFFVYGPRQFAGTGYPSVIVRNLNRILAQEPPVIFGDGLQVLDYVFVRDVVEAVFAALACHSNDDVINVGSGHGVSVVDLTKAMLSVSGSSLSPALAPPDATAGSCRIADVSRAQRQLGWRARTPLYDGLRQVWEWLSAAPARIS